MRRLLPAFFRVFFEAFETDQTRLFFDSPLHDELCRAAAARS
jgi:hypothetical protein